MLNDTSAFSSLVRMHQSKVRSFLFRLSKNSALADDIAQDAFITAYIKIASFSGTGSFIGWLLKIAYNEFLQTNRRERRRQQISDSLKHEIAVDTPRYENISSDQLDLERAMILLTPEQAAAITLCYSYGFTHQEAATILSTPVGTIKTNVLRGKDRLRKLLELEKVCENKE